MSRLNARKQRTYLTKDPMLTTSWRGRSPPSSSLSLSRIISAHTRVQLCSPRRTKSGLEKFCKSNSYGQPRHHCHEGSEDVPGHFVECAGKSWRLPRAEPCQRVQKLHAWCSDEGFEGRALELSYPVMTRSHRGGERCFQTFGARHEQASFESHL
jgi:hypothetical protein